MDPISGTIAALSSAADAASNFVSQGWNMDFNRDEAKKATERQAWLYKHRYQWAVSDMKKAGLNPMLAAGGGMAGSPSGGFSATSNASSSSDVVGSLNAIQRTKQDIERSKQDVELSKQQVTQSQKTTELLNEQINTQKVTQENLQAISAKNLADAYYTTMLGEKVPIDSQLAAVRIETERAMQRLYQSNADNNYQTFIRNAPITNLLSGADVPSAAKDVGKAFKYENMLDQWKDAAKGFENWLDDKKTQRNNYNRGK